MDLKVKNKTALVTGGSSGIGAAIAQLLAKEGADVIIAVNKNIRGAQRVAREIKAHRRRSWLCQFDVSFPKEISDRIGQLAKKIPKIDMAILCAGQNSIVPFQELNAAEWARIVDINLNGTFYVLHELIPLLADKASIVIVSSVSAHTGSLRHAHYAAAKAGLVNLTKSAARALAPNVRVNCVAPGITLTKMGAEIIKSIPTNYQKDKLLINKLATPEEIAQFIVFVASPLARFMTGTTIDLNGGRYLR